MATQREELHGKTSLNIPDLSLGTERWSQRPMATGIVELRKRIPEFGADAMTKILEQAPREKKRGNYVEKKL